MLNELDLFILENIIKSSINKKSIKLWELTKNYDWKDKKITFGINSLDNRFLNKKYMFVTKRLKIMSNYGIIRIIKGKDNKNIYEVVSKNVRYKKFMFPKNESLGIAIKFKNKWIIYQLN